MDLCQLCNKPSQLVDSHIIPKFIFRWQKQTGTGLLRGSWNFNVRIQDGIKTPLLCQSCEGLFNEAETYFGNNVFFPVVNDRVISFDYDDRLFYFVVSVLWRLLKHSLLEEEKGRLFYDQLRSAEAEWRNFLLTKDGALNFDKMHLLVGVDVFDTADGVEVPDKSVQYMARGVDAGIADNETAEDCILFLKLPRFKFIIPVHGMEPSQMFNTVINPSGGHYDINHARIGNPLIRNFFVERIKLLNKMFEEISPVQKEKMRAVSAEKWDEIKQKDLGIILDYERRKFDL